MTRRERLENKVAKRAQWAAKREQEAQRRFACADEAAKPFENGQPILVGHHSEKMMRAAQKRIDTNMHASFDNQNMAEHHREKASGLEKQLEESIFDDDPDALEKLTEKVAKLEERQALMVAANKICRNKKMDNETKKAELKKLSSALSEAAIMEMIHPSNSWQSVGFDSYVLSNNNANIKRCKERIATLEAVNKLKQRAEDGGGVVIDNISGGRARITFAEKPERETIAALKDAGFYWSKCCWIGERDRIPSTLRDMLNQPAGGDKE